MLNLSGRAGIHRPTEDGQRRVIVIANRAPFCHQRSGAGRIVVKESASGLVTALQPLLVAYHGTWVAHGSGDADAVVVDAHDGLNVTVGPGAYRLRYVWLPEQVHLPCGRRAAGVQAE